MAGLSAGYGGMGGRDTLIHENDLGDDMKVQHKANPSEPVSDEQRRPLYIRLLDRIGIQHNAHWMLAATLFFMGVMNIIYGVLDLLYFAYTSSNVGITLLIYVILQDVFLAMYLFFVVAINPYYAMYDARVFENSLDVTSQMWSLLFLTAAQNFFVLLDISTYGLVQTLDPKTDVLHAYYWTQWCCGVASGFIAWVVFRYYTAYVHKDTKDIFMVRPNVVSAQPVY